ncbi:TetR/AcrR family transcriptional regulator [Kiloniella laminariae]|uniref:TetR/AcrR family transcriptional regulator n=1 Tax=Kiloniella laminariae TaxID=454162 RepID=A0ABT4LEF0_9PROT|nr:TetR/AcrR family transcriptional regulator [Kiloniella laminariae]MCZ4279473.1 TetR/AcrR family transcriptional regulator [Kiloniella laminariae]
MPTKKVNAKEVKPERPSKKEETHARMLAAAGRSFRRNGFAGIGVDGIAKAAGVTSGAFYAHFGSKDAAFFAAVVAGLDEVIDGIPRFQKKHGPDWLQAFADYYLGQPHRDDLACGCAMTSLSPEIVRGGEELHQLYETKMFLIAGLIAAGLAGGNSDQRLARAWGYLGTLIGGLTITRAMQNRDSAETIAKAIKSAALGCAGEPAAEPTGGEGNGK